MLQPPQKRMFVSDQQTFVQWSWNDCILQSFNKHMLYDCFACVSRSLNNHSIIICRMIVDCLKSDDITNSEQTINKHLWFDCWVFLCDYKTSNQQAVDKQSTNVCSVVLEILYYYNHSTNICCMIALFAYHNHSTITQ